MDRWHKSVNGTRIRSISELMMSPALRKVLYCLLHLGNYLNHGAGSGNAVGFRLGSLCKVEDVKAVGARERTLLHFVAKVRERRGGGGEAKENAKIEQMDNCAEELGTELANVREAAKYGAQTRTRNISTFPKGTPSRRSATTFADLRNACSDWRKTRGSNVPGTLSCRNFYTF